MTCDPAAVAVPVLIIVSGDPGTGKSTIAQACSEEFRIPVLSRDTLKELMFDALGWSDRAWSRNIGSASFDIMFYCLGIFLDAGSSVILDCNLSSERARETLRSSVSYCAHTIIEVICQSDPDIALGRFERRVLSGARHPGHADASNMQEFATVIGNHPRESVVARGIHLVVDTSKMDEEAVCQKVFAFVRKHRG